jgi:hypothetical protein
MMAACLFLCSDGIYAQLDIGKTIKKKVEKKAESEVGRGVDKGIEEAKDAAKDDEKKKEEPKPDAKQTVEASSQPEPKAWSRYDFVSGDKVIFEDNLVGEQNGEFPSRWDLVGGNAENASFGTDNVISYQASRTEITPLMKTKSYLPEIFTIEFDLYFHLQGNEAYVSDSTKRTRSIFATMPS